MKNRFRKSQAVHEGREVHAREAHALRPGLDQLHLPGGAGRQPLETPVRPGSPYRLRAQHLPLGQRGGRQGTRVLRHRGLLARGWGQDALLSRNARF